MVDSVASFHHVHIQDWMGLPIRRSTMGSEHGQSKQEAYLCLRPVAGMRAQANNCTPSHLHLEKYDRPPIIKQK
jgi:hypothetical protein